MTNSHRPSDRQYLFTRRERFRRHVRQNGSKAVISGISVAGITAGFLSAAAIVWPLLAYVGIILFVAAVALVLLGSPVNWSHYLMAIWPNDRSSQNHGSPRQLELVFSSPHGKRTRLVLDNRCADPIYGAGMRSVMGACDPIIIMPSNPRDVGKAHELLYPMYVAGQSRSHVEVDLRSAGIPLAPLSFDRELPEGDQDPDHTLAIRDLVYIPDIVLALQESGACIGSPVSWPEHCVDPKLIAARDVIVIGGPDTNFWHAALFEAVARDFEMPKSSIPLAMSLREKREGRSIYGSRSIMLNLFDPDGLPRPDAVGIELDERIFPTVGMILACRNPFAAAVGASRWCIFVAGTRSLGTSGAALGLAAMLRIMQSDPNLNFASTVPTTQSSVYGQVAAILCRTSQVEQAMLRRGEKITERERRTLQPVGLDPFYSDTYLPTDVEYLRYDGAVSKWERLCSIPSSLPGDQLPRLLAGDELQVEPKPR